MGGHAGVLSLDGTSIGDEERTLLPGAGETSTRADLLRHSEPFVAMTCRNDDLWIDQGEPLARTPHGVVLAFDGRLDNRHDLLLQLGQPLGLASDAAVAAAAFERWGADGLRTLIGEWSAAIWNPDDRTLSLARDYMGGRPLYYAADGRRLRWSTSLRDIVSRSGRDGALNDCFVAAFMTLQFSTDVTPYVGVHGVPAGTATSFLPPGRERRTQFWRLNPGTLRFRDRRDYEHGLRALFADAVASRLRTSGTVWAELSGGFDSSAVVCMADTLIRAGEVRAAVIQPISYVTLRSPEGDERRFIAEVEGQLGRTSVIIGVEDHHDRRDADLDALTPLAACGVALEGAEQIRQGGGRLILTGRSGDSIMGCEPYNSRAVCDDIERGDLVSTLVKVRQWSRVARKPFFEVLWDVARRCAAPQRTACSTIPTSTSLAGRELLTERLQRLVRYGRPGLLDALSQVRPSKIELATQLLVDAASSQLSIPEAPEELFYSHPYTHRPLVDYVLSIPGEQLSAPGEMRSLMRRAFAGFVPGRILRRVSKGYYPPSTARGVRVLVADLPPVERLQVVERGWIDPGRLAAAIATLDRTGTSGSEVRRVLRLERWLETRQRRAPADIPRGEEVKRK